MSRSVTAFEHPQFKLIPDDAGVRMYANVSNDLVIENEDYSERENPVVIPTSLFLIMKDILKIDPSAPAFLYLVKDGPDDNQRFVLGLAWSDVEYCDLWSYSPQTLPKFLQTAMA